MAYGSKISLLKKPTPGCPETDFSGEKALHCPVIVIVDKGDNIDFICEAAAIPSRGGRSE
jgi:hypothetical protein